jgi:TPR repeat protein
VQTEIRPQVVLLAVLSFLTGGLAPAPTQASSFEGSTESCTKVQVKQIEQEATKGSATAQKHLGDLYAQGQCVSQDYVQAASWYRRSAEQENAEAQLELGMFLLEGKEVPQDAGEAAKWFRRAAEQNLHPAQYALGSLYSQGRGVPKNLVEAYKWIRISAPKLDTHTHDVLATLAKSMTHDETDQAEAQAQAWMTAHGSSAP